MTFPPKTYPPTAPYDQLTSHFKKLVREGLLTRFLVKALLYPQFLNKTDTSKVILRRHHKTHVRMYRRGSPKITTSGMSDENSDETTHSEYTEEGSCSSNPFGFVKYYMGNKQNSETDRTEYESFIDHGPQPSDGCKKVKSVMSINCELDLAQRIQNVPNIEILAPRESLPICSKTTKICDSKENNRETVIHTSTARLNLSEIKQYSEASAVSSFDNQKTGPNIACEDLSNIDESLKINNTLRQRTIVDERHSMPPLFVGNRFNASSITEVYIPSWKDKHDLQASSVSNHDNKFSTDSSPSTTTHSSSLDLPAIVPVPDKLTAELLYNFDSVSDINIRSRGSESIIHPPSMFDGNKKSSNYSNGSQSFGDGKVFNQRSNLRQGKKDSKSFDSEGKSNKRPESVRRCMSVQYMNLNQNRTSLCESCRTSIASSNNNSCKCGEHLLNESPRSSDSGMAGSCTLASPGPPKTDEFYDQNNGYTTNDRKSIISQNGKSRLRHSLSSHNIGQFSNNFSLPNNNDKDNTDSGQYGEDYQSDRKSKISNLSLNLQSNDIHPRLLLHNIHSRCRSTERNTTNTHNQDEYNSNPDRTEERLYRTGLYAHWWKKQKLPREIVEELYRMRRRNELASDASYDIMEGSGKPNIYESFIDGMSFLICILFIFLTIHKFCFTKYILLYSKNNPNIYITTILDINITIKLLF